MSCLFFLFFFSSRRRHTRSLRDWSSDVCSSDLGVILTGLMLALSRPFVEFALARWTVDAQLERAIVVAAAASVMAGAEIGRASCRERVEISGVAVSVKRKGRGEVRREVGVRSRR